MMGMSKNRRLVLMMTWRMKRMKGTNCIYSEVGVISFLPDMCTARTGLFTWQNYKTLSGVLEFTENERLDETNLLGLLLTRLEINV